MFGKNWQTRWDDTIKYINRNLPPDRVGDHIERVVPQGHRKAISGELSLGSRSDGEDDPQFANNTSQRQALRALLLCQRVYFSALWAGSTPGSANSQGDYPWASKNYLDPNWKRTSLEYWKNKSELAILEGLRMFSTTTNTADAVAVAAESGSPDPTVQMPSLTLTRATRRFPGDATTCYGAVRSWMLQAGIVSYRWYMRDVVPTQEKSLTDLFGDGTEIWSKDTPFTARSVLPDVPRGYVVHMYDAAIKGRWNGHWMVSVGGGMAIGCNNGDILNDPRTGAVGVGDRNWARCSLGGQFIQFKGEQLKQVQEIGEATSRLVSYDPKVYEKGRMVMFDPARVPNR